MGQKSGKERLYRLIEEYLSGEIGDSTFCDEFYYCYDLELDHETLTEIEKKAFGELSAVSSRFSEHQEDHMLDPRAFSTAEELKQKVVETKEKCLKS